MINAYKDLSEDQFKTLFFYLDKASKKHLNKLKESFPIIKKSSSNVDYRDNILHSLMMEEINFTYFTNWLSQVHLHGNNSLYIYESDDLDFFRKNTFKTFSKKIKPVVRNIYDINASSIKEVCIAGLELPSNESQIIITLASPGTIQEKNPDDPTVPKIIKEVYLAYIIIDFKEKHFVLSLHPTHNLINVNGIPRKQEMDSVTSVFMDFFRLNIKNFNYKNPDWLINALAKIVHEYYHHNNPLIDKKKEEFENEKMNDVMEILTSKETLFSRKDFALRIKKSILSIYEDELIQAYKVIPKESPFKVTLHETGKGLTQFVANSKGKPMNYADSRVIVKMMTENSQVISLGITYSTENGTYPYKISKTNSFYSLKRVTNAGTEKEIVDDVLHSLKKYQSGTETKSDPTTIRESK